MPLVTIKMAKDGLDGGVSTTKEQKEKIIKGITNLLVETLGKNPKNKIGRAHV